MWLDPQKNKNDPQNSNLNVRIQGIIDNESCSTTILDPKTVFEPTSTPKVAHSVPQKPKKTPKLKLQLKTSISNFNFKHQF